MIQGQRDRQEDRQTREKEKKELFRTVQVHPDLDTSLKAASGAGEDGRFIEAATTPPSSAL